MSFVVSRSITYLGYYCQTKRSYDRRMHVHTRQFALWMPAALRRTVGDRYIADTGPDLQKGRI
jgi:hypothetical protein